MDNKINLNELWQGQNAKPLNKNELLKKVNALKTSNYKRIIMTTLALSFTSIFICWIWVSYNPQLITTKIGIVLTILSMAIYGYTMNRQYPILTKLNNANANTEYLEHLLALKKKQTFLQTTMMNLYFIMLSAGILLYMIEPTSQMESIWAIVAYGLTIAWIFFAWFYLRPRQIKKQQVALNEVINKFENIKTQFEKD